MKKSINESEMLMAAKLALAASNRAIEKAKEAIADCHHVKADIFISIAEELTDTGNRYSKMYLGERKK